MFDYVINWIIFRCYLKSELVEFFFFLLVYYCIDESCIKIHVYLCHIRTVNLLLKFKWFIHNKLILLFNRYLIRKGCESLSSTFCSHDFFQDFSLIINSRTFVLFYPDYWNCLVPCYLFKWGSVTEIEIVNLCSLMKWNQLGLLNHHVLRAYLFDLYLAIAIFPITFIFRFQTWGVFNWHFEGF
jgi:hypothetical protein